MKTTGTGFTLIELLAVLVLMGIMAAVVGLSLAGRQNLADEAQLLDRIKTVDARARVLAERSTAPMSLVFDFGARRLWLQDDKDRSPRGSVLEWNQSLGIRDVRMFGRSFSSGTIAVPLSNRGTSPTYMFSLSNPQGKVTQFVTIGLTGEVAAVHDEKQIQKLLQPAGHDAP